MGVSALQNSKDPTANSQSSRYSGGERQQVLRGEFNDIMEQIVSKLKHCGLDTGYQDFAVEAPPAKLPSKVTSAEEPALTEHQAHVPNEDPPVKEGKEHANTSSVKQEESEQDETGKDDTSQVENSDVSDTVQAKSSSVEEAQTETKEGAAASEQPQEALADQASPDQDLEVPESASDETTELSLEESIEAESEEVAQLSQESSATVSKEKQTADETVIEEHDNQEQVVESKARQIDKSQQGTDQSMDQEPSLGESSERPVTPHPDLKNLSEQPQTDESLSDLASKISKELREKVAEEPVVKTEIPDVSIKAPNQDIAKQNPRAEVQNHLAAMLRAYLEQSGALNDKPQLPNVGNSNATIVQAHAVR
ncbi:MAG: hypothetical protein KDD42_04925, partial [Bdellovibrionales bacterium]|nr:hypothetical protein [Bdellovibrionales bacterium]